MSSDELYALTVQDVVKQAADVVTITLRIAPEIRDQFHYLPGQYLMVRHPGGGEDEFRSYSICQAPPAAGGGPETVRIAVRLLGPGGFGEFAHSKLSPGDTVDVLRPTGRFRLQPAARHIATAAGSGITPVLAMAEAALLRGDEFSLVYGNRTEESTMFADEIADLEVRFPDRFTVLHVLSRVPREHHRSGRIDAANLPALLGATGWGATDEETHFYLCGPAGMVKDVRSFLTAAGVGRKRVHSELFSALVH
ncbi:FAD-binding oxidoreductase [Streptomyces sp. NPDC021093]|uniref:FAD-binding oxidoreductase n=1 Tax=Streptomyces sp. NPDC021093 TaxID=3365112 RepID=UPI0037A32C15